MNFQLGRHIGHVNWHSFTCLASELGTVQFTLRWFPVQSTNLMTGCESTIRWNMVFMVMRSLDTIPE